MGVPAMYYVINVTFILFGLALLVGGILLFEFQRKIGYVPKVTPTHGAIHKLALENKVIGYIIIIIFAWSFAYSGYKATIKKLYMDDDKVMNVCGVEYYQFKLKIVEGTAPQIEPKVYNRKELIKVINSNLAESIVSQLPKAKGYALVSITDIGKHKKLDLKELKNFKESGNNISGTVVYKEYDINLDGLDSMILVIIPLDIKEGTVNINKVQTHL